MKQLFSSILCIFMLIACSSDDKRVMDELESNDSLGTKILFIGNSHTYFNEGVAKHVQRFGGSFDLTIFGQEAAEGGFTLENHLNSEKTLAAIEGKDWDIIVLQENSYRAAYEQEEMQASILEFVSLLGNSDASIYLYQTWAYQQMPEMNPLINQSYTNASSISGYPVLRIGNLWSNFSQQYPDITLYNGDTVHAAMTGTYLTSAFFFKKFFNYQDLSSSYISSLNQEEALIIQEFVSNNHI